MQTFVPVDLQIHRMLTAGLWPARIAYPLVTCLGNYKFPRTNSKGSITLMIQVRTEITVPVYHYFNPPKITKVLNFFIEFLNKKTWWTDRKTRLKKVIIKFQLQRWNFRVEKEVPNVSLLPYWNIKKIEKTRARD